MFYIGQQVKHIRDKDTIYTITQIIDSRYCKVSYNKNSQMYFTQGWERWPLEEFTPVFPTLENYED